MMAVLQPEMTTQFTMTPSLPKFSWLREAEFYHFSGGVDLVTSDGQEWKEQRAIYNTGFSSRNITSMAPWFLEEVLVFKNRMLEAARRGETIKLEKFTMDLTFDVIARATLLVTSRCQLLEMSLTCIAVTYGREPKKRLRPLGWMLFEDSAS